MIRIALIRHGHTPWNRAGQIQGRTDIALDQQAKEDLSGFSLPAEWHAAQIVSSPLKRATETAGILAGEPVTIPALTEMNWGDWEGLKTAELGRDPSSGYRHIEEWGWGFRPPQGESLADVRARVMPWVLGLTTDTLAVCHIGIMRVVLGQAFGWNFTGEPPFTVKRNRLFVLELNKGSLQPADPLVVRLPKRS
ncbi:histidine phosphatase family protein [Lentibacter algarum]|uniref:histidine phosphatase family protein n=1 Tax=Lentibacter algarum TaxID=576131 RepID=UPI001C07866D|nr:histidine phosphatase family protein [Lentibacter algarum]MBU2981386.1 histidine phosphatase family protein [Lentibacter algarum]